MSFWNTSDGKTLETNGSMEMGGGDIPLIPAGAELLASIDESKIDEYGGAEYVSNRWTVHAPEEYKNRKIYQKLWVYGNNPNQKDPQKAAAQGDKAKRMLMAIDHNCGGKLKASGEAPSSHNLASALCAKPMIVKVQVWEIFPKDENGNEDKSKGPDSDGNWISSVAARGSHPQPVVQPATTSDNVIDDNIPF